MTDEELDEEFFRVSDIIGRILARIGYFMPIEEIPSRETTFFNLFKMNVVTSGVKAFKNGEALEIDVMAYDHGSRNEVYLVEVKFHLTREDIDQMLNTIERFPKFFRDLRDRTIYGVIAAKEIPDKLRVEVLNKGLYLARIQDGEFELLAPPDFKPTAFRPAVKQNGRTKKRPSGKT